ncbi:MAG: hypothetical protein JW941_06785 [Candidatus Coatesbacteria bacterium]|nr:hypothetical protein [Candidatus Coatesbacteria bacterium]
MMEMFFDFKFIILVLAVCVGVFALVYLLKLRPREIRVFASIFAVGIGLIIGMYILTFFHRSLSVFYAYAVLATAIGILLFIYYRYFAS